MTLGILIAARRFLSGLLISFLAGTAAFAADPGVTASEVTIGQSITLQGTKNVYGGEVLAGVRTVFDEVNRNGGVHGRQIVLKTLDDDNKSATAEANARKLIAEGVFLIFGSIEGGPSTAVMKATEELKVPFFGPMAGSPTLRRPFQSLVFPVRAEHREEFRALIKYGRSVGLKRVAFFHSDSETGLQHLANVKLAATEAGADFVAALAVKSEVTDAQMDAFVKQLREQRVEMILNHGSASVYEKLIRKARAAGVTTTFLAVNSASSQLAGSLGPLGHGMVFSQVVPSPWARKTALAREYQDAFRRANPAREFSYGSLEGYATAKALVAALTLAGGDLSRAGLVKALQKADLELGGMVARYRPGDHAGSSFVDLALVTREGKFLQ